MKFFLALFLFAILVFGIFQIYTLYTEKNSLADRLDSADSKRLELEKENRELERDIEYYQDNRNAAKEAASQFNYKAPDEELYILTPSQSQ